MMTTRARAFLVIAVIAVCSAIAGAAVERVVAQKYLRRRPPMRGSPEQDAKRRTEMLDRMTKDLGLDDTQRSGIDTVMRRTDSLLKGIRTEMNPRIAKVFEESRTAMMARMTPEQRAKFENDMPPGRRGSRP